MRSDLPTGVVTLLFTDIEGSTRLLAEMRGAYVEALATHRRTIRTAVTRHAGVEVDTQGDAFLVAFARPSDALAAAIEAQRALADGPIRVRMGLHTGEPELTEEGYVGLDVHRGARIGDAGHGGQILLSTTTRALVSTEVTDLGEHRLAGIAEPERIYAVRADGLRLEFPPLRTADAQEPDLPTWLTSFVGRESELELLDERLSDPESHVITVVGPGGAGKTRLVAEAARRRWAAQGTDVAFATAIAASDEEGLVSAMCDGVGFEVDSAHGFERTPRGQLIDYLASRERLVIVDNVEHLEAAGDVISDIAARAPSTRLLVTSRRRLGLSSEWVVELGGLGTGRSDPDVDATDPAARLFLERARRTQAGLTVADEDWVDIRRICDQLDGMPLAIELAAAWVGTISVRELAEELSLSLDLLDSSAADIPARHRSLRAAFDGSWRLLDDTQRDALAAMSVFVGSFERTMARDVAGCHTKTLSDLVSRSLVRRRGDGRYEIHELVRQYAARELELRGRQDAAREAHARAYVGLLEDDLDAITGPASLETRTRLGIDDGNLRAALEWAVERWPMSELEPALLPASALWTMAVDPVARDVWLALERVANERRPASVDAAEDLPARHICAPHVAFALAVVDDNEAAESRASEHLPVLQAAGREVESAMCQMVLGINCCNRWENEAAIAPLEAADATLAAHDHRLMRGELLTWLGWARLMLDDPAGARHDFETAYEICSGLGEPLATAFCLSKLGLLEDTAGNYAEALEQHLAAFASFDAAGNGGGVGYSLSRASLTASQLGQYQAALDFALTAYEGFSDLNHYWGLVVTTARLGYAYLGMDRSHEAERWGLHSLGLAAGGNRIGQLHALGVVAGSMARRGDPEGWALLDAIVDDPDMPALFAIQMKTEQERLGAPPVGATDGVPPNLDEFAKRLLLRPHPAPILR